MIIIYCCIQLFLSVPHKQKSNNVQFFDGAKIKPKRRASPYDIIWGHTSLYGLVSSNVASSSRYWNFIIASSAQMVIHIILLMLLILHKQFRYFSDKCVWVSFKYSKTLMTILQSTCNYGSNHICLMMTNGKYKINRKG